MTPAGSPAAPDPDAAVWRKADASPAGAGRPAAAGPEATGPAAPRHCRDFAGTRDQVATVRRFVADIAGRSPAARDAALCVSELFANAIFHSASGRPGGTITVRVQPRRYGLLAEITDQGGPWRRALDGGGGTGRGLVIVSALASRFGIAGDDNGRTSWFLIGQERPSAMAPSSR